MLLAVALVPARRRPVPRARSTHGDGGRWSAAAWASARATVASTARRACPDPGRPVHRRAHRSSWSPWPGRRRPVSLPRQRAPSSSRSTCRAAWPPTTSRRPGWTRPRRPARRSSSASRRASSSASSPSATRASRSRRRRATRPRSSRRSTASRPSAARRSGRGSAPRSTRSRSPRTRPPTDYYSNRSPAPSPTPTPAPVAPGSHTSAVIVLLTDGENNEPPDPLAGRPGGRRPGRPDRHGRHRQRGRDDPRPRRVQGPHAARRGDAPADRRHDRRRVLRGRGRARPGQGLRRPRHASSSSSRSRSRSPRSSRARACCSCLGGLGSLAWLGRLP